MKESILSLGIVLNKSEQEEINGGHHQTTEVSVGCFPEYGCFEEY